MLPSMLPCRLQVRSPLPPLLVALTCYQGGQRKKQPRSRGYPFFRPSLFPQGRVGEKPGSEEAFLPGACAVSCLLSLYGGLGLDF